MRCILLGKVFYSTRDGIVLATHNKSFEVICDNRCLNAGDPVLIEGELIAPRLIRASLVNTLSKDTKVEVSDAT